MDNAIRASDNQVMRLFLSHELRGRFATLAEIRRPTFGIMGIASENVGQSIRDHPLAPVTRAPPEPAEQRSRRDLHPYARRSEPSDRGIVCFEPRQPFRMSKDRHEPGREKTVKAIIETRRRNVVRQLEQDVPAIGQG